MFCCVFLRDSHHRITVLWGPPVREWANTRLTLPSPLHFRYTKPQSFSDCVGNELPLGWEEAYDKNIGVYYVNHVTSESTYTTSRSESSASANLCGMFAAPPSRGRMRDVTGRYCSSAWLGLSRATAVSVMCNV